MKILFISDNFYPEKNAPAIRTYEHCLNWLNMGHEVTVLTSNPNFPKGEIYNGYKNKIFQKELIGKVKVIRVWTFMSKNEGFFFRTLDYISFALGAIFGSIFIKKPDVIIGTSPQFFTVISTCFISYIKKTPWVFELRDLWPDSIAALEVMSKKDISFKILKKIEIFLYKSARCIIPVTHSFKRYLENLNIDKNKIQVITNGINLDIIFPIEKDHSLIKHYDLAGKLVLGYIGTHGLAHDLETILIVVKNLNDRGYKNKILFFFIGEGSEKKKLISFKNDKNLDNVFFIDNLDRNELKKYWSILDISLIHLKKIDLFKDVIPSKFFESMGMNIPILLGVDGEARKLLQKYDIGEYFEPQNITNLYDQILKFFNNRNLLKLYKKNAKLNSHYYDRTLLSSKMISFIEKKI